MTGHLCLSWIILSCAIGGGAARSDHEVSSDGNALLQLGLSNPTISPAAELFKPFFKSAQEASSPEEIPPPVPEIKLKYKPVIWLHGCRAPRWPDFGPNPKAGPLKGLGQHLQVALEASCTNFFMRCAYASGDFDLLADGISRGLLATNDHDTSFEKDQKELKQGLAEGARAVHLLGVNPTVQEQEAIIKHGPKCDTMPDKTLQLIGIRNAIRQHFRAYGVSPDTFRADPSLASGIALAFCDQIGDTGTTPCNDVMARHIRKRYIQTHLNYDLAQILGEDPLEFRST